MKRIAILGALIAALILFFQKNSSPAPATEKNLTSTRPKNSTRRSPQPEKNFWDEAIVADPDEEIPLHVIRPEDLGVIPPTNAEHPSILLSSAIAQENLPLIHSATLAWFALDPQAARDWLAAQDSLDELQPAIVGITAAIAESHDIPTAMEWLKLLTDDTVRESTLFDIQALALRNRRITPEQIVTDGLSADHIEQLLSGAAGD